MPFDELHDIFLQETTPLVGEVQRELASIERTAEQLTGSWRTLLGALHTIKGNSGMAGVTAAQALAHTMEQRAKEAARLPLDQQASAALRLLREADELEEAISTSADAEAEPAAAAAAAAEPIPPVDPTADAPMAAPAAPRPAAEATVRPLREAPQLAHVRVAAEALDHLLESVSWMVMSHAKLAHALDHHASAAGTDGELVELLETVDQLGKQVAELRAAVVKTRLLPLDNLLARFDRLVRDLGERTGKQVGLEITGADHAVDKSIVDHLGEPLMHIVRNAIDHGLEEPAARRAAGKPVRGTVAIEVEQVGGEVVITVRDDGRGIPAERLAELAAQHGLDTRGWSARELCRLIFLPGLSTAARVTELSGRGVGMDQAKRAVERIGGSLDVDSAEGQGTRFELRVPLVVALRRVLLIDCAGETVAVPITGVREALRVERHELAPGPTGWSTSWRGQALLLRDLATELGLRPAPADPTSNLCVILEHGHALTGLFVDRLQGQEEVVIRELDPCLGRPWGIAGAAVLRDGRPAMVLDARVMCAERAASTAPAPQEWS